MTTYGHVIKFERMRQNIKQVELAKDICSPAYLSKIESNSIVPSVEIREKLFVRLNLNSSSPAQSEEDFLENVRSIYFEAIMYKDRQKTEKLLKELESTDFLFQNTSHFYTYQLMTLRLHLIVGEIQAPIPQIMKAVSEMASDYNDKQSFTFKLNIGFFHFMKQDFSHSENALESALEYAQIIKCEDWEIADLEYALALVYLYQNKNLASLQYSKQATSFFKKRFYYTRVIESYLILAIGFRRIGKYKDTFDILQLAKKISLELNLKEQSSYISANLGNLLAEQGRFELAIENFKECLTLTDEVYIKATCMCSIMMAYSKMNDESSSILWSKKGIEYCRTNPDPTLENIIHHFHCQLARLTSSQNFEETFKKSISYYDKKKENQYAYKYSVQLAQYYLKKKEYKNSSTYYSLANKYLASNENRKHEEDL